VHWIHTIFRLHFQSGENGQCHVFCYGYPNAKIGVVTNSSVQSRDCLLFHSILVFWKSGLLRIANGAPRLVPRLFPLRSLLVKYNDSVLGLDQNQFTSLYKVVIYSQSYEMSFQDWTRFHLLGLGQIDLMHNDVTRLDAREECWY
jgi:hypothetical protein